MNETNKVVERRKKATKRYGYAYKLRPSWTIWKWLTFPRWAKIMCESIKQGHRSPNPIDYAPFATKTFRLMDRSLSRPLVATASTSTFYFTCFNSVISTLRRQCIKTWLQLKNVCPLCHAPVFKDRHHPAKADDDDAAEADMDDLNENGEMNLVDDFFEDLL